LTQINAADAAFRSPALFRRRSTAMVSITPSSSPAPARSQGGAPADPFADLRQQIDRVFEGFFGNSLMPFGRSSMPSEPFFATSARPPNVDVKELADGYEIAAELPGIDEKDIDVTVREGVLTLRGEKRFEKKEENENLFLSERSYGTFQRSFRLPDDVDPEGITARFEKGVLKLHLPKAPEQEAATKKIEVKSS
jgi:HSP20 family protein